MKDATFTINTDAYPDANIEFTYTNIHQTIKAEIIDGNKLKFDNNSWNNNAVCGISKITATVNGKVSFLSLYLFTVMDLQKNWKNRK